MISIVTPSYNQGNFIEATIQSVLSQDIEDLDYVVMDGGSQDQTLSILKRYANQLRYVSEKDRGQAHAVNKAIMMTSGDIIGWLNSDDIYYPGAIKKISDFFAAHPDIDVVYGKANHIDEQNQFINSYPTKAWDKNQLTQQCFISQPAVFFRRRVIEKCGLLNESLHYCLDYEFWLRLAQQGMKFAYLEDILAGSRLHVDTKTLSAPEKAHHEAVSMLKHRLGYVPMQWLVGEAIIDVKKKTQLRSPAFFYLLAVSALSIYLAFRWNGFLHGLRSCLQLPQAMISVRRAQKK